MAQHQNQQPQPNQLGVDAVYLTPTVVRKMRLENNEIPENPRTIWLVLALFIFLSLLGTLGFSFVNWWFGG